MEQDKLVLQVPQVLREQLEKAVKPELQAQVVLRAKLALREARALPDSPELREILASLEVLERAALRALQAIPEKPGRPERLESRGRPVLLEALARLVKQG